MTQATRMALGLLMVGIIVGIGLGWILKPAPLELAELEKKAGELEKLKPNYEKLLAILGEVPSDGIIKMKVWALGDPASVTRVKNIESAAELFNKMLAASGVKVTIKVTGEYTSGGDADAPALMSKYVAAYKAKEAPDIIGWKIGHLLPLADEGMVIPLDEYITKYKVLLADVYATLWESVKYKGKLWALPQDTEARPLYFRKDVLRKLGWTEERINTLPLDIQKGKVAIEDLIPIGKEAMGKGLVKWAFYHRPSFGNEFPFVTSYYQFGGILQDPTTLKLVMDKEAMLKSFRLEQRMAQVDKVLPPIMLGMSWRDVHMGFVNGEVMFWFGGTWHWAEYQVTDYHKVLGKLPEAYLWDNVGFALSPAPSAGLKPLTVSSPVHYLISAQSKYPELAFVLAEIATSASLDAKHAADSGHLAVRSTTVEYPYYKANKFLAEATYMLEYTTFEPVHPKYAAYKAAWIDAVASVETGAKTPEKALTDLETRLRAEIGDEITIRG